jgi:hypothetical protein
MRGKGIGQTGFVDNQISGPLGWVMMEAIQIQVNGEQRSCQADATVGDLLRELAIKTERVAVEVNLENYGAQGLRSPKSETRGSSGDLELYWRRRGRITSLTSDSLFHWARLMH